MDLNPHQHARAPRISARLISVIALASVGLAAACGAPAHPAAANGAGIQPGAGQSLPGFPAGSAAPSASGGPTPRMTMPTPTGTAPVPVPQAGTAVTIRNFAFGPAALTVNVGTTVTWTNQDSDAHTVTSQGSGGPLHSAALNTGARYSYTFTKPGTYAYLCTIHPFMTATVTVTS